MEKTYQPKAIEQALYHIWEANNYFQPSLKGLPFCVMLPPPNVTGSLHMGHGFQQTLMDVLVRYHRMLGDNTLWQVGTDHAGIATQMVVENQLAAEGKSRRELGREAFLDRVWKWKDESGSRITRQMRRLGVSADWATERFTMDEGLSQSVQTAFIQLYREGLIYRGKRLTNWDPVMQTAVSDLEVVSNEEAGSMWHIQYPIVGSDTYLIVATTRPETLLGDVAVAVHPEDPRYQALIGKMALLPICNREIPIIADTMVDPAFGTGCVKITPAHDFNDYEVGKRHQLPLINILTQTAKLNENAPEAYQGLDRFEARTKIVSELTALGLLESIKPHTLKVPRNERGNAILEPFLIDQWYVSMKSLAEPAIQVVKNGQIKFIPEQWENTYFEWLDNIQDWCISRQLWWGHRIPAWYDDQGQIYVGESESQVRAHYTLADTVALRQDEDVLDTWFSSALWPFSTLGWPEKTPEFKMFYPTSVLVTGFDIIFFWVARMIMFALKFTGQVPFSTVYIHGLIRDSEGQKMSKTKGNVLDPIDLIDGIDLDSLISKRTHGMMQPRLAEKIAKSTRAEFPEGIPPFGTDALRFTYCALASTSRDINFNLNRLEGYRNFCNKLWNATRFVLMQIEAQDFNLSSPAKHTVLDHWIWASLDQCVLKVHQAFAQFRFDWVAEAIYEFVWNEYCDWYLEFAKVILSDPQACPSERTGTCLTVLKVLAEILKLAHPIIPFITEALWKIIQPHLALTEESLMLASYPKTDTNTNLKSLSEIERLKACISQLRTLRSEQQISPAQSVNLRVEGATEDQKIFFEAYQPWLCAMAKIKDLQHLGPNEQAPLSATAIWEGLHLHVPLSGVVDLEAKAQKLGKELATADQEIQRLQQKLAQPEFRAKAPPAVIAKEEQKLADTQELRENLLSEISKIKSIK